jgi:hypothetical protein
MKILVLFTLVYFVGAQTTSNCKTVIRNAGLSVNFNETIAHTIHSMTVQGLQKFNPRATDKNNVPTVNMDRHSDEKVIPYAPEDALGDDFSTPSMNTVDKILSNIGKDNDGLGPNWSPLERIVHKFHMLDVWDRVLEVYKDKVVGSPPDESLCDCLMNTDDNGIYAAVKWVSDHYDSGTPITLLNRPIPKLRDAKTWGIWKYRLLYYYSDNGLRDAAIFLHCATKDF